MKRIILIASVLWFVHISVYAQNLVPNPSFEQVLDCDLYFDDFDKVKNWKGYNFTPDLFHSCSQSTFLSTPKNTFDSQTPAQGLGYAGILTYHRDFENELIGVKLVQAIQQGKTYQVSFKISRAMAHAHYATNNIGVLFTNYPERSYNCQRAHINERQVVEESDVWHTITGTFEADSTYNYLVIGNFFGNSSTILKTMPEGSFEAAYYFVDEVYVAEVPLGSKLSTQSQPSNSLVTQNYRPKTQNPSHAEITLQKVKTPENPTLKRITLKGKVLDAETRQPLTSMVEYQVPYTKEKATYETNYETGDYAFENLPVPPQFEMKIQARNYYTIIQSVNVNQETILEKIFYLQPLRAGQSIPLTSIGFKPGPEELTSDSFAELNRLIQILKDNPLMKIEVGGYTNHPDRLASSKLQAQSVKDYLVKIGSINPNRVSINIFLETTPQQKNPDAADEKTEVERVAFKILN
ncbi:MAG: OmpA family protein [Microscillaceae bacterium]|nr:OmpA family protein [Microscillaceae bacterium]